MQAHSVPALQILWSTPELSPQPCDISSGWDSGIGFTYHLQPHLLETKTSQYKTHSAPALQSWWSTSEESPQPCDISDNWNGGIGFCLLPTKPPLRDSSACGETYNNCKEIVCEDLMISTRIVTITLWHSWLRQWYRFFLSSTKPYFWFQYHKDQRVPVPALFSCEK